MRGVDSAHSLFRHICGEDLSGEMRWHRKGGLVWCICVSYRFYLRISLHVLSLFSGTPTPCSTLRGIYVIQIHNAREVGRWVIQSQQKDTKRIHLEMALSQQLIRRHGR